MKWLIWTIYDHPADYPQFYVARAYDPKTGEPDTATAPLLSHTLKPIQDRMLEFNLFRMDREPGDDPVIIESWI